MRGLSPNRTRASGPVVALWVTVASLAIHGLVFAAVGANGYLRDVLGMGAAVRSVADARPTPDPRSSCAADEALATAAQAFYCATPLAALDSAECFRKALDELQVGHARCQSADLPPTSVALLDPKVLDHIEPEPLEELLAPEEMETPKPPPPPEEAQAQPAPPPPPTQNTQVVEVTRPETEEAPENTRFLSEYDTRVDKETVARGSTEEMVARPEQRELQPVERPREASVQENPEEPAQAASAQPDAPEGPGRLAMRAPGTPAPSRLPRQETTPGIAEGSEAPPTANGAQIRKGTGELREAAQEESTDGSRGEGGGGGRPRVPNLRPTAEVLERAVGGGSVDLTEGIEEGELTALSSKQWKHASFFNRMKRQVAQNWNPGAVLVRRDPNGKVYGGKDRVTLVRVTLDASGALVGVVVLKSSGVEALDEEATRAFRAAQPFPNPPAGMISDPASQQISFTFGFHVEMGAQGWRIFRAR